jgi:hypothetical protein
MKNLINAITTEKKNRLNDFIKEINKKSTDFKTLDSWIYTDLLPKSKKLGLMELTMTLKEVKAYLIERKQAKIYKEIEKEVNEIKEVFTAGKLVSIKISVEWKKSQMWGANPTAEAWMTFINKEGSQDSKYVKTVPVSGCGYDKLSTAVANVLNQFNEVLKPMYVKKNALINHTQLTEAGRGNHKIFGYGSGYGILPYLEGGVGVSCYPRIFESIGYKFESVASGKSFDVFQITKIK